MSCFILKKIRDILNIIKLYIITPWCWSRTISEKNKWGGGIVFLFCSCSTYKLILRKWSTKLQWNASQLSRKKTSFIKVFPNHLKNSTWKKKQFHLVRSQHARNVLFYIPVIFFLYRVISKIFHCRSMKKKYSSNKSCWLAKCCLQHLYCTGLVSNLFWFCRHSEKDKNKLHKNIL